MTDTAEKSLVLWGMEEATFALAAARENRVYRVEHQGRRFALRLHRQGLRTNAELLSELQWMAAVRDGGLLVPSPIAARNGALLQVVDDVQVDMLSWLAGEPLGATGKPLRVADRAGIFSSMGREMARLHEISDSWMPPETFVRGVWDREGLVGDAPLWGRFWDNPALTAQEQLQLLKLRDAAQEDLTQLSGTLDYGLIHADLVRENVMVDGDRIQIIDFDDSGFGYRLFDIATALLKNREEADYEALKSSLLSGYRQIRNLDTSSLDLFLAIRACTYVGWIMTRMDEDGARQRNRRFIDTAVRLAVTYLNTRRH